MGSVGMSRGGAAETGWSSSVSDAERINCDGGF